MAPSGRNLFRAGPKKKQAPSSQQSSTSVNEKDFEMEKIVDVKLIDDKLYYHFRWLGYADEESTWVSIDTLINAVEKIRNFQRENSEKMVKVTSEPAIEGKRMSLIRGTTHVEKVLVICLKEAIDEAEIVAVEFTNSMIISVSKEEVKLMSDHNQMKIKEEIILQNELQLQQ